MKVAAQSKQETAVNALSGADKKPDMKDLKAREITIRRGHKGGFIAKHRLEDKQGNQHYGVEPEFPLMDMKALQAHMQEHMGDGAEPDQDDAANQ
jgi:hypothetical protein